MADLKARIEKSLQHYFRSGHKICAMLVTDLFNVRYLSGFTGTNAQLILTPKKRCILTDSRYISQVQKQCPDFERVVYEKGLVETVAKVADELSCKNLGFEGHHVTFELHKKLSEGLENCEWVNVGENATKIRMVKDEEEVKKLKKAASIAARGFLAVKSKIVPGAKESNVAMELEFAMRQAGGEGLSFETIVASGSRSALPHGVASEKKIEEGDLVVFDYGAMSEGYHSDETITFTVGQPSARQKEIFQIVWDAQRKAIDAVRPGVKCADVDRITRDTIAEKGYGKLFGHGTGHGVGLEIHEEPRVSWVSQDILEEGMVVTVEPGIYIEGWGGVRIEDMVLVTARGAEILTRLEKSSLELK
ncbi:MAG: aminopeptidase P family protein [Deltaproteobacteria bacterium]|nr:aminopeptidase P family protein [Deltaproteobacteria bacterium]